MSREVEVHVDLDGQTHLVGRLWSRLNRGRQGASFAYHSAWRHGFIGYQVGSVPLEPIADVVISRTLPEILAGMSSIHIRDMTGQTQPTTGLGAKWIGVKDAPEIQKRILEQIKQVNAYAKRLSLWPNDAGPK